MKATVKYESGRTYGIASASGVAVSIEDFVGEEIAIKLAFSSALTTGDCSWQADYFGNDAYCDEAQINLNPQVALRLAETLLEFIRDRDHGNFAPHQFAASVNRDYKRHQGVWQRVVTVSFSEPET